MPVRPAFVESRWRWIANNWLNFKRSMLCKLQAGRAPFVMVGFNRRFAPFTENPPVLRRPS